ncbi:MAG: Iron(III) transport system ATP-binding protein [Rhodospirillales bacterium]|nr:Iron(III) transport system ATP-binding protein [Rhodospirillales bacterium]
MLRVAGLSKVYGQGRSVIAGVKDVAFDVKPGEFFTLLGPSGCGKTTTLRSLAGLEQPSAGEIEINGKTVFSSARDIIVPTAQRDIAMVFQSYAVWPHMTIGENVAFPLEAQRLPPAQIRKRVEDALAMVGLEGMAARPAPLLSGGQQQRVALARAIVKGAPVLLLDEPLSNLDAKLREQMRRELRELQRRIGTTAIYVTHDQEEALSLSDRIAVMQRGEIVELDTPHQLYYAPRTVFTARFIGQTDVWPSRVLGRSGEALLVESPFGQLRSHCYPETLEAAISLVVRPEHIDLAEPAPSGGSNIFHGTIAQVAFSGRLVEYLVRVAETNLRVQSTSGKLWETGATVRLRLPPERCIVVNGAAG